MCVHSTIESEYLFFWLYGLHQYITGKLFPRVTVVHVFTALQLVCQLRLWPPGLLSLLMAIRGLV